MVNYEKLLKVLRNRGYSQSYISTAIGMSRGYLRDCIKNNTDIPPKRLERICILLGTSPAYLCDETEDAYPNFPRPKGMSDELWESLRGNQMALKMYDILINFTPEQRDVFEGVVDLLHRSLEENK